MDRSSNDADRDVQEPPIPWNPPRGYRPICFGEIALDPFRREQDRPEVIRIRYADCAFRRVLFHADTEPPPAIR